MEVGESNHQAGLGVLGSRPESRHEARQEVTEA